MNLQPEPRPPKAGERLAMIAQAEKPLGFRPRIVMAHTDSIFSALSSRHFRRLGWEVHVVGSGPEARRLVSHLAPSVVILGTELPEESGWLTCAKLISERPGQKVILLTSLPQSENHQFATFVGASAVICQDQGVQALADEVLGTALPAAG